MKKYGFVNLHEVEKQLEHFANGIAKLYVMFCKQKKQMRSRKITGRQSKSNLSFAYDIVPQIILLIFWKRPTSEGREGWSSEMSCERKD